jgi:hypothetical protein
MDDYTISPDGNWLWNGREWIPAPPKSSTEMIRRASEDISQVSTKNRLDHEQLSQVASHFDLNQDGVLSSDEIQNAADSILNPPAKSKSPDGFWEWDGREWAPTEKQAIAIQNGSTPWPPQFPSTIETPPTHSQFPIPTSSFIPSAPIPKINQQNFSKKAKLGRKKLVVMSALLIVILLVSYAALPIETIDLLDDIRDSDSDGIEDSSDAFPLDETEWVDTDGDGVGDNSDSDDDDDGYSDLHENSQCRSSGGEVSNSKLATSIPPDFDGDMICNFLDSDDDNDSILDEIDVFPFDASEWFDFDLDGIGDNADTDDDNDGISDVLDMNDYADTGLKLVFDTFRVITAMDYFDNQAEVYLCMYIEGINNGCGPDDSYQYWSLETGVLYGPLEVSFFVDLDETVGSHLIQLCAWDSDAFDDDPIDISTDANNNCYGFYLDSTVLVSGTTNTITSTGEGDNTGWDGEVSFSYELTDLRVQRTNTFTWDFNGNDFSMDLELNYSVYSYFKNLPHDAGGIYNPQSYGNFATPGETYIIEISNKLNDLATDSGYITDLEIAEFVYAFVGDIQYLLDIEGSGESDYPKYPIEMLWEASGDCEDAAILYISLIEALGYDALIVTGLVKQSEDEDWGGHAWAAVNIPGEDNLGTYWYGEAEKSNLKFYFVEATAYRDGTSHIGWNPWYDLKDESYYDVE